MKVDVLEPVRCTQTVQSHLRKIRYFLSKMGYEIEEVDCDERMFPRLLSTTPDVVFNLSNLSESGNSNLTPAVLEIAGVPYTGSGILGLSLARNYSKLLPLFCSSGINIPSFRSAAVGELLTDFDLETPIYLVRDGESEVRFLRDTNEAALTLEKLPFEETVTLIEYPDGLQVVFDMLDGEVFPPAELSAVEMLCLDSAKLAYRLLEARGLVRFTYCQSTLPCLVKIEVSPDPLDGVLISRARKLGWTEETILQKLIEHAGRDQD